MTGIDVGATSQLQNWKCFKLFQWLSTEPMCVNSLPKFILFYAFYHLDTFPRNGGGATFMYMKHRQACIIKSLRGSHLSLTTTKSYQCYVPQIYMFWHCCGGNLMQKDVTNKYSSFKISLFWDQRWVFFLRRIIFW